MAKLKIHTDRVINNIKKINDLMEKHDKQWTLVTKVLGGHKETLKKILNSEELLRTHSIGDSRVSSLKNIKKIRPDLVTLYLKPPGKSYIKNVVKYSDISLNTDYSTIKALNEESKRQKKKHRVMIMIEMGELREGVVRDKFLDFYEKVFKMSNINIIGLGTNLGCMYGIEPTFDKLIQLSLYKQLIESRFNKKLKLISGGSSITLPLLKKNKVPKAVNHMRIGEAVFLGTSPLTTKKFSTLSTNAFEMYSHIVELEKKESRPDGVIGDGNVGHAELSSDSEKLKNEFKAVLDFGVVDVDVKTIKPKNKNVNFIGTTSDLTVYSLGKNSRNYKTGDYIKFNPSYMAVARLMNSKFIEKQVT